jgi:hypothetical protein
VDYLKVVFQYLPGGTEENHEKAARDSNTGLSGYEPLDHPVYFKEPVSTAVAGTPTV